MESTRIRLKAVVMVAAGLMFTVALVCAPLLRIYRWIAWPTLAIVPVTAVLLWQAGRLWAQLDAEVMTEDTLESDPTRKPD